MIQFINPVDILNLAATDLSTIDDNTIKRAKKATLAEIDLSDDGFFDYHESKFTRADCERVIDELEDHDKLEFYHFIANYPTLNRLLANGDDSFFTHFRHESIYKLPEFVQFISPYFAAAYDNVLWKAWQRYGSPIGHITAVEPIVVPDDIDNAYKGVRNDLTRKTEEIRGLYERVRDTTQEVNVRAFAAQAEIFLDTDRLNMLPPYFQDLRNTLASAIRTLSAEIYNQRGDLTVSMQLNIKLHDVKTDGVVSGKIRKDHQSLLKNEQTLAMENDPVFKQYRGLIVSLANIVNAATNKQTSVIGVNIWLDNHVNIAAINADDERYHTSKVDIAIKLMELASAIWHYHHDGKTAIRCIELAENIHGLEKNSLEELSKAKQHIIQEQASSPAATTNDPDGNNEKLARQLIIMAVVVIILFIVNKGCHS